MARKRQEILTELLNADNGCGWPRRWGRQRPTYEELGRALAFLISDEPVDGASRRGLFALISHLNILLRLEDESHRRGIDKAINTNTTAAAAVVNALRERHGIKKVVAAVSAVVDPDVGTAEYRRKLQDTIARVYRKLKASGEIEYHQVNETLVSEALARINSRKSGNK